MSTYKRLCWPVEQANFFLKRARQVQGIHARGGDLTHDA